jgi:hypothetical protein
MISLEQRGVLQNKFAQPFRRRPEWKMQDVEGVPSSGKAKEEDTSGRRD